MGWIFSFLKGGPGMKSSLFLYWMLWYMQWCQEPHRPPYDMKGHPTPHGKDGTIEKNGKNKVSWWIWETNPGRTYLWSSFSHEILSWLICWNWGPLLLAARSILIAKLSTLGGPNLNVGPLATQSIFDSSAFIDIIPILFPFSNQKFYLIQNAVKNGEKAIRLLHLA